MEKAKAITINIGTKNPVKIKAVKIAFSHYFRNIKVNSFDVDSKVGSQPKNINTIVKGAKNRARAAFVSSPCTYSVGIEAGIFKHPCINGYMDTGVTIIFDGKRFYYGYTPLIEFPKFVVDKVLKDGAEVGMIMDEYRKKKNTKQSDGAVGFLTDGVIKREEYICLSVIMALAALRNKRLY